MTNAVAVIALTYAATDIQHSDFGIFLEIVRGLNETPTVRGEDTIVPGDPGRTAGSRVNDVIGIELRGYVRGVGVDEAGDRSAFATNRAAFRALFASNRARANLVATLEDGSTATISARPLPGGLWDQIVPGMAKVSIELEGYDDWVIVPAGS